MLLVGSPSNAMMSMESLPGAVLVFKRSSSGEWFEHQTLESSATHDQASALFGFAMAIVPYQGSSQLLLVGKPDLSEVEVFQLIEGFWDSQVRPGPCRL